MPVEELIESRPAAPGWRARWTALPARRRLVVAAMVVVVLVAGGVRVREWAADRALQRRVAMTVTLGVSTSSTSPPGGSVVYAVRVRNLGRLPIWVTSVEGGAGRIRLAAPAGDRRIEAGRETSIPMSVLVTCARPAPPSVTAVVHVRRADGGSTAARGNLQAGATLVDVAATLCAVRPESRGYDLSGPTARVR